MYFLECSRSSSDCQKNFLEVFNELDADFFCVQETKLQAGQIELELPNYYQYWNYAQKKAILVLPFLQNMRH